MTATSRSVTSRTGSPGTSEAVCPSGPSPRWTRSKALGQGGRVVGGGRLQIVGPDRHRADVRGVLPAAGSAARWVRLRSGSPVGRDPLVDLVDRRPSPRASCPASSANIAHGVRPPLNGEREAPVVGDGGCAPRSATTSAPRRRPRRRRGAPRPRADIRPSSRRARRTACASPRGVGPRSRPCRGTRSASRAPSSAPARARPPRSRRSTSSGPRPSRRRGRRTPRASGDSCSACAVRSSSQEPTTLPRRQTSATSVVSISYW